MKVHVVFEDEDDFHLVVQLALRLELRLSEEPRRINLGGYDPRKLRSKLSNVAKEDYERVVLVLDADHEPVGGPARRWKEVVDALRAAKIDIPGDVSTTNGLVHHLADGRRIAVWLFPDCRSPGAMEDFVLERLIADGDPLLAHAATVVDALPEKRFPAKFSQKARMRSWLAWQERPGLPPGRAVVENALTVSEERLGAFAVWLRSALG